MKKLIVLLSIILLFTSCVSRVDSPTTPAQPEEPVSEESSAQEPLSSEPTASHALENPEEVSEIISIVSGLLTNAKECDLIFTGSVAVDKEIPSQVTENDSEYFFVDSKYKSISDIENLWVSTFIPDGKARISYDKMIEDKLYGSFNGQLYIKDHSELPPMTMGSWDLDSIVIKLVEEDQIAVEMETQLVGQPNGVQTLYLFNVEGAWLLSDSFFL